AEGGSRLSLAGGGRGGEADSAPQAHQDRPIRLLGHPPRLDGQGVAAQRHLDTLHRHLSLLSPLRSGPPLWRSRLHTLARSRGAGKAGITRGRALPPSGFVSLRASLWGAGSESDGSRPLLLPEAKLLDDPPVPLHVLGLQIGEQPPALSDQHHESAPRMMVLRVRLEVLRQVVDPFAEDRDLDLGRARIRSMGLVPLDDRRLLSLGERHPTYLLRIRFPVFFNKRPS